MGEKIEKRIEQLRVELAQAREELIRRKAEQNWHLEHEAQYRPAGVGTIGGALVGCRSARILTGLQ